jgi:hypothetical protein
MSEETNEPMSQELELASRAMQEVLPAATEFAEAAGLLGPPRALADHFTRIITHRLAAREAKVLKSAAEKIRATGISPRAVSDKFLRAALEDAAFEDDATMQERYANLLANAFTAAVEPPPAFPGVLHDLSPRDAAMLDRIFDDAHSGKDVRWDQKMISLTVNGEAVGLDGNDLAVAVINLARLRLIHEELPTYPGSIPRNFESGSLTPFGRAFVLACRPPAGRDG